MRGLPLVIVSVIQRSHPSSLQRCLEALIRYWLGTLGYSSQGPAWTTLLGIACLEWRCFRSIISWPISLGGHSRHVRAIPPGKLFARPCFQRRIRLPHAVRRPGRAFAGARVPYARIALISFMGYAIVTMWGSTH